MLEDEQVNLKRAEERLAAVQAELKALAEKGPPVSGPTTEGLHVPPFLTVWLSSCQASSCAVWWCLVGKCVLAED